MRKLPAALLVLGAACSSGGGSSTPSTDPAPAATPSTPATKSTPSTPSTQAAPTATPNTGRVTLGSGATLQINSMNLDTDVRLFSTGTPDQVFAVLPAVYTELGIPMSVNDTRTKTVGNSGWRTRRSVGKVPMQRYLDCGSSGTLQNAETYQINMTIMTTVVPNQSGGSVVSTAITAVGKNPVTSSSADVRCATKGDLEIRIRDMVQKRIEAM